MEIFDVNVKNHSKNNSLNCMRIKKTCLTKKPSTTEHDKRSSKWETKKFEYLIDNINRAVHPPKWLSCKVLQDIRSSQEPCRITLRVNINYFFVFPKKYNWNNKLWKNQEDI